MPRLPSEPDKRTAAVAYTHELIGCVATDWAALEHYVNETVWALAETPPAYGACMTAQIFTINGRLRALLALLKLRRADKKLIRTVNDFAEAVRGPADKRNRIIHDPWGFGLISGSPSKLEITANKKLVFRLRDVDITELEEDRRTIHQCVLDFVEIRDAIFAALPSFPDIPQSELRPIIEGPRHKT